MSEIPKLQPMHILKGDEFSKEEVLALIKAAVHKKQHDHLFMPVLKNRIIALLFQKPSLRTRFSFHAGILAAGGYAIESVLSHTHEIKEQARDMIRVLQGYCDAVMLRTYKDSMLEEMAAYSKIPIINGLSDMYHPCQILSDLLTLYEHFGTLDGLKLCYVGDGNNILHTFMLMAPKMGIELHYACPKGHEPKINITHKNIIAHNSTEHAVAHGNVVYTDVWTSMGEEIKDESVYLTYQVNETLMSYMDKNAVFLHCLPMERGKEVSHTLPDSKCSLIFQQSQNRMYMQLVLLESLLCWNKNQLIHKEDI